MNKDFHAWFAGFFDGEGTIDNNKKYSKSLKIVQAIKPNRSVRMIFYKIQKTYGGSLFYVQPKNPKHYLAICWRLGRRAKIEKLIANVIPFIKFRKKDLEAILGSYQEAITQRKFVENHILYSNQSLKQIGQQAGCSATTICRMRKQKRNYFRYDTRK